LFFQFRRNPCNSGQWLPDFINPAPMGLTRIFSSSRNGFQRKNIGRVGHHYGQALLAMEMGMTLSLRA